MGWRLSSGSGGMANVEWGMDGVGWEIYGGGCVMGDIYPIWDT